MLYLLLRGALVVVDCVREVTRRSLRSRCANALPTLLRGATDEAMNTPAHVVTEAGVVSCGRKTCAGAASVWGVLHRTKIRLSPGLLSFVSPLEFAPFYVTTDAGVVSCGGKTCGAGKGD